MSRRPAFQFYPADWRKESSLRLCSVAARGLWIEMMVLMHEGEPYGHLTLKGKAIEPDMLARLIGENTSIVKRLLKELDAQEVFSRTADGVIYSRRMVRDEDARERRAAGGAEGAKHGHKGGTHGAKGGRPKKDKTPLGENSEGGSKTPLDEEQKPPPSSSSSSSPSGNTVEADASTGAGAPKPDGDDQSGSRPSQPPTDRPVDVTKAVFDSGVRILGAAGKSEREARTMLGLWRSRHGDGAVLAVLARCDVENPTDPVAWITAGLQAEARKATGNGHGTRSAPRDNRDGFTRALDRELGLDRPGGDAAPAGRRDAGAGRTGGAGQPPLLAEGGS